MSTRPRIVPKNTSVLKLSNACCSSPSPIFFAITAEPPAPSITPKPITSEKSGLTMLSAESASTETNCATNTPSTIV